MIAARAIEKVVRAVTADQFGVAVKSVTADLLDEGGQLDVAVRTPIRVVPIARLEQDENALERSGGTVLERAERSHAAITEQVHTITGSKVSRLALRLTEAEIRHESRVR